MIRHRSALRAIALIHCLLITSLYGAAPTPGTAQDLANQLMQGIDQAREEGRQAGIAEAKEKYCNKYKQKARGFDGMKPKLDVLEKTAGDLSHRLQQEQASISALQNQLHTAQSSLSPWRTAMHMSFGGAIGIALMFVYNHFKNKITKPKPASAALSCPNHASQATSCDAHEVSDEFVQDDEIDDEECDDDQAAEEIIIAHEELMPEPISDNPEEAPAHVVALGDDEDQADELVNEGPMPMPAPQEEPTLEIAETKQVAEQADIQSPQEAAIEESMAVIETEINQALSSMLQEIATLEETVTRMLQEQTASEDEDADCDNFYDDEDGQDEMSNKETHEEECDDLDSSDDQE